MCEGGRQPQAWWGGMRCAKCAPAAGGATRTSPAGCGVAHRAAAATARLLPTTSASSARDARDRGTMAAAPHAARCVRRAPPSLGHTRGCACVAFARCRWGPPCGSACARDTPAGRVAAGSRVFERCAPRTGARASRAAAPGLARLLHQVRPKLTAAPGPPVLLCDALELTNSTLKRLGAGCTGSRRLGRPGAHLRELRAAFRPGRPLIPVSRCHTL